MNEYQETKDPYQIINNLSPTDALEALRILTREDKELAFRVAEVVTHQLVHEQFEEVAGELFDELESLEVEDVWDRAGKTRHGYVEPAEAAYQMVGEVLEPYLEEMKKYQRMSMSTQAQQLCMGLLLGLYEFERESSSEFKDWAPDSAPVFADEVLSSWKAGSPSQADSEAMRRFSKDELKNWVRI